MLFSVSRIPSMMCKSFRTFIAMGVILVILEQSDSKSRQDSKIVGGFSITLDQAPFLVSIQRPAVGHFCGGSLLTLGTVLTGCHCLALIGKGVKKGEVKIRKWEDLTMHVGSENIDDPSHLAQKRNAKAVKIHPNCSFEVYLIYDFGVIFTSSPFVQSPTVHPFVMVDWQPGPLEIETRKLIDNDEITCMVAGWGAISATSGKHYPSAQGVRMKIINDNDCASKLGRENIKFKNFNFGEHGQMCSLAYGHHKNASDCVGDSGGPFYCGIKVFGLVSYGYDCGFWDTPNVYAKVSYFIEWYRAIKDEENDSTVESKKTAQNVPSLQSDRNLSPETMVMRSLLCILIQINVYHYWLL